eukprot:Selendium_serpulae@DN4354_c0_g1_i3.p1
MPDSTLLGLATAQVLFAAICGFAFHSNTQSTGTKASPVTYNTDFNYGASFPSDEDLVQKTLLQADLVFADYGADEVRLLQTTANPNCEQFSDAVPSFTWQVVR